MSVSGAAAVPEWSGFVEWVAEPEEAAKLGDFGGSG